MIYVAMIPALCSIPWLIWLALEVRSSAAQMETFNPLPKWEAYDRARTGGAA